MSGFALATMTEWFMGQMGVEDHLSFSPWVSFETGYISIIPVCLHQSWDF